MTTTDIGSHQHRTHVTPSSVIKTNNHDLSVQMHTGFWEKYRPKYAKIMIAPSGEVFHSRAKCFRLHAVWISSIYSPFPRMTWWQLLQPSGHDRPQNDFYSKVLIQTVTVHSWAMSTIYIGGQELLGKLTQWLWVTTAGRWTYMYHLPRQHNTKG